MRVEEEEAVISEVERKGGRWERTGGRERYNYIRRGEMETEKDEVMVDKCEIRLSGVLFTALPHRPQNLTILNLFLLISPT